MKIHASGEDYLEAVLVLQKNHGAVRSIDVARRVGVSKASVSYAVSALREGGFLTVDSDYVLHLTETGRNVAEKIYERHQFFTEQFIAAGVDPEIAERDACRIEHAISQDTFEKIRDAHKQENRILMPVVPTVRTRAAGGENISPLAAPHEDNHRPFCFPLYITSAYLRSCTGLCTVATLLHSFLQSNQERTWQRSAALYRGTRFHPD